LYYRSDHYNFAKHNVPVAFFFDGIHEDYHKPTDDPEKIDYQLLEKELSLFLPLHGILPTEQKEL
jgi:Zn-dependent M28 family amino/carboxypeptidase